MGTARPGRRAAAAVDNPQDPEADRLLRPEVY